MRLRPGMFWTQVWYILILTWYKIYSFPMSLTLMIKLILPIDSTDTTHMLGPGQGDILPSYVCHPLFPQVIGASPTQIYHKIQKSIILDDHVRLRGDVANDDWGYLLRMQVVHIMFNKGYTAFNPLKTCSHDATYNSIPRETQKSGRWGYILSLHLHHIPLI